VTDPELLAAAWNAVWRSCPRLGRGVGLSTEQLIYTGRAAGRLVVPNLEPQMFIGYRLLDSATWIDYYRVVDERTLPVGSVSGPGASALLEVAHVPRDAPLLRSPR
jgi:hypothetical protein